MDDKGGRRLKIPGGMQQIVRGHSRRSILRNLRKHNQAILTGVLLVILAVLLIGVFSTFPAPVENTAPSDVTVVDYSSFTKQVEVGNVLAVTMRGNGVNALLEPSTPSSGNGAPTTGTSQNTSKTRAADISNWKLFAVDGNSWLTVAKSAQIDPARAIYTRVPEKGDTVLMSSLLANHVEVVTLPVYQGFNWSGLIWTLLPLFVFLLLFLGIMRNRKGANMPRFPEEQMKQLGKSRARRVGQQPETDSRSRVTNNSPFMPAKPVNTVKPILEKPTTFADVAGIDEVRTELEEIVQFLRDPGQYNRLGARIPRGALLVGPPGTGKTLLARAVAGEAGVPFFSMSASEFVEMFVGIGASRVRDLFAQARQAAPCVVFIDEIDAVGRKRSMRATGSDERDQTLNQLLVEMDGFDAHKAIVVLAATNRADILDKALLRPGRFDRHITVSLPDRAGRQAILKVHTRKTPLSEDVDLERLARLSTGMSGADLANLVNEAALAAARQNLEALNFQCFEDALARVQLGALRPLVMSENDRRIIAFHEAGHALVAYHLPQADRVNRVTILPRGQSLGVTHFIAEEDRYNYSRQILMEKIAVGLGGRSAEEQAFGLEHVTTGAENDLQVVTDLAHRMVTRWGMSEEVGVMFANYQAEQGGAGLNMKRMERPLRAQSISLIYDQDGQLRMNGEAEDLRRRASEVQVSAPVARSSTSTAMSTLIDTEMQRIINEGRQMARTILAEHADQLVLLADTLMEREQLNRVEFESLLRG
ncbi:MAG TPA: ATP-dependent zinc metalloprotease FtsH [Ktedonobacteraceae bacterium]|nr:ATP-dependent zinc metalloprotease FtsH [Ktedonobacteraceae bacterium]